MTKFTTKLKLTTYLASTSPREAKYVVINDETLQNKKSVYQYTNGELILLSNEIKTFNWRTSVATFAALSGITSPAGMDAVVVLADETHNGQPTQYYYNGYNWIYNGIYFVESLQISVSARNERITDIVLNTDYTIPFKYVVGSGHLEVFFDDVELVRGVDFAEIGTLATVSNIIQFKSTIPKEARLVFKRDIAGVSAVNKLNGKVDVYYFDTFADAQNSPFLLDEGQVLRTFGHVTKNDGKGRYWILEATDKDFGYKNKASTFFINRMISADEKQIGEIFPKLGANPAPESIPAEGQIANRVDYKRIWDWAVANNRVVTEAQWVAGKKGYFSSGDESTTFRFPNFKNVFLRVKGDTSVEGTYIDDIVKAHNHTANAANGGVHNHRQYIYTAQGNGGGYPVGFANVSSGSWTGSWIENAGDHTHTITVANTGGIETAPKHIALPHYIKI